MTKSSRIERQITNLIRSAVDPHYVDRDGGGLPGTPDLASRYCKIAVFVDGCYWHGCPEHSKGSDSETRQARDTAVNAKLDSLGWAVFRVWEHEEHLAPFIAMVGAAFADRGEHRRNEVIAHIQGHHPGEWCNKCDQWPHESNASADAWCTRCDVHTRDHEWEEESWRLFAL